MENEELKQVEYDCRQFLNKLEAVKKAEQQIKEFKGKPREETLKQAIILWEREKEDIKKTLIPYMKKLINILETK
ncbi:hypothetical protein [Tenacibaculum finnmarkense]|uniref:hypothetical protein n=1 Tax=Tenacibaculum finnmarkense TaxID=2781243 RepID=UPI003BB5CE42